MNRLPLGLLFVFAACTAKDSVSIDDSNVSGDDSAVEGDADADSDADTDTDTDADSDVPCEAEISSLNPTDGMEDVSPEPTIYALLSATVSEGQYTVTLEGPEGTVTGQVSLDMGDTRIGFTPDMPLERDTEYTATFLVCESTASTSFTTVGEPIGDVLAGRTYDVDLNTVIWHTPSNGGLLVGQLDTDHLLFMVESVDSASHMIDFVGAAGNEDPGLQQYPCAPAFDFDPTDFSSDPYFQIGPQDTTFTVAGSDYNLWELTASGAFDSDGSNLNNMRIHGYMDVRDLEYSGVTVCSIAPFLLGASCVACPNDGVEGCLELDVESTRAPWEASVTIDPNIDPTQDPNCN